MSYDLGHVAFRHGLEIADRLLKRRWLKVVLFLGVFLAAWLMGMKSAHALQ